MARFILFYPTTVNAGLVVLNSLENELHKFRQKWPVGLRSVDDQTKARILELKAQIKDLKPKIEKLRKSESKNAEN